MKKSTRAYIYAILVALGPLASFYGLATQEEIVLWLGVGGTILGIPAGGLALKNLTPDEPEVVFVDEGEVSTPSHAE